MFPRLSHQLQTVNENASKFSMLSIQTLQAIAQLEVRSKKFVTALLSGQYRSPFKGSGMHFKEFRHYEFGDDIRHMSWAVTARTGRPTIKVFEEDRQLNVQCFVDCSGSSFFGSGGMRRVDAYAEMLLILGLATTEGGDTFSSLFFDEGVRLWNPPARNREKVLMSCGLLLEQKLLGRPSDLRGALSYASQATRGRSIWILLSDFLMPNFQKELRIACQRHEVILLHCSDAWDQGTQIEGLVEVWDPELGEFHLLDANRSRVRERLRQFYAEHSENVRQIALQAGAEYYPIEIQPQFARKLVDVFHKRSSR